MDFAWAIASRPAPSGKDVSKDFLMTNDNARRLRAGRVYLAGEACDLTDFRALIERTLNPGDYPFAGAVVSNVLIYDGDAVR